MTNPLKSPRWWLLIATAAFACFWLYSNVYFVYFYATNNDFKHLYFGGQALVRDLNPYDNEVLELLAIDGGIEPFLNPYVYPPLAGLLLSPLTAMPFQTAAHVWQLLNHVFLIVSILLVLSAVTQAKGGQLFPYFGREMALLVAAIMLASLPNYRNISAGQLNGVLLICVSVAIAAECRGKSALAGAALAVGAMVKIIPGLLILHYVIRRDWRAVGAFTATCLLLLGLSLCFVRAQTHLDYLPLVAQMGYGHSTNAAQGEAYFADAFNQAPSALWFRLFTSARTTPWFESPPLAKALSYASGLGILALAFWLAWRSRNSRERAPYELALWTFPMLLCPSLMWDHYLVLLIPVVMLAAVRTGSVRFDSALVPFVIGLVLIYLWQNLGDPSLTKGWRILLISTKTYGALLVFYACVVIALRRSVGEGQANDAD